MNRAWPESGSAVGSSAWLGIEYVMLTFQSYVNPVTALLVLGEVDGRQLRTVNLLLVVVQGNLALNVAAILFGGLL